MSNSEAETYEATRLGMTTVMRPITEAKRCITQAPRGCRGKAEVCLRIWFRANEFLDLILSPDVRFVYQNELVPIRLDASNLQIERTPNTPPEYLTINLVESATRKYG